jgi:hypothetical protein
LESHIKVVGMLYMVIGVAGAIASLIFFFVFGGPSLGAEYSPMLGIATITIMGAMLALALPMIVVGIGLLRFHAWARWAGTILSVFCLLHFPFGTITGVYALSVLLSPDTDPLFNPRFDSLYLRKP